MQFLIMVIIYIEENIRVQSLHVKVVRSGLMNLVSKVLIQVIQSV